MRRILIHLWLPILVVLTSAPASAAEQRIAAIVNDDVVSLQDLDERLGLVLLTSRIPDQERARERLAKQVLRGLIEESLQLQEARRLSVGVAPDELERALADIAQRNQMSSEQLQSLLERNGINPNTLLEQLRAQIAWVKVVNQRIRPQVNVTVDQLEIAVEEAQRNQGQPEYLLSEIVLPVDNPNQEQRVAADAAKLVQTLSEGASFEALARQVSASATARRGGDVGWVPASTIPGELVSALERLRPGDVSQPLRSPVGFYIFQLRDRRLGEAPEGENGVAAPVEEVRLSQLLFAANIRNDQDLSGRVDEALLVRDRLSDCAAVNAVAEELKAEASGDIGWLKVDDLPAVLGDAVRGLPIGEISPPLQGPGGVHLLMVCDRRGGAVVAAETDGLSEEERQKVVQQLERERLDRLARRYLRDLRKQAFIDVRI
ncbi:MAG: peptidylprolyl isomerase [Geminicoccaceae bacterium]